MFNALDKKSILHPVDGNLTSGEHLSVWFSPNIHPLEYETLNQNIDTDVLIIGGGISGLTTAYCLAKSGLNVVLVEDGFIGSGESGRTTAHVTSVLSARYFDIEETLGKDTAQLVANSHMAAIEWLANTVQLLKIDCHFKRLNGYLFLHPFDKEETLQKEYEASKRVSMNAELLSSIPFVQEVDKTGSIKFADQAQLHIMLYLKGLADAFIGLGGKIFTKTKASNISPIGADANGFKIKANHIVVATNSPVNNWITMHTKQWPYRTYVIASKIPKGKLPYALWWDTGDQQSKWLAKPYHYVRLDEFDEQYDVLISGGEDHRTGQADDEQLIEHDRYLKLEEWTKSKFPVIEKIDFKWSGQVLEPLDGLAFIGKNPGDNNIYIITGQSGNGITYGTLGGLIITDLITGKENQWSKIYDPSRVTLKVSGDFVHEAGNMIVQYADWIKPERVKSTDDLKPGEGGVVTAGLKKIAVYRDAESILHQCSAVCPHMGAILQWNADEMTFDCPAHGSRFSAHGKAINGPSSCDLKKIII